MHKFRGLSSLTISSLPSLPWIIQGQLLKCRLKQWVNLVYSVLILFSVVLLYHASTCGFGYYCPATENCKNTSYCQEGTCPVDGDISNMTESYDIRRA